MEWQVVDEKRHPHASEAIGASVSSGDTEDDLGFQRFNAEDDELTLRQTLGEALMIQIVFLRSESHDSVALVGHKLAKTFGSQPGQVSFEGPQGLLSELSLLLFCHAIAPWMRCQFARGLTPRIITELLPERERFGRMFSLSLFGLPPNMKYQTSLVTVYWSAGDRGVKISAAKLCRSWLTLAAVAVAGLAGVDARASCPSMADASVCAAVCACCQQAEAAMPAPAGAHAFADASALKLGRTTSVAPRGCVCRAEVPTAPAPRAERTTENRSESRWDIAVPLNLGDGLRLLLASVPKLARPSPESPLYLRTSRLLI